MGMPIELLYQGQDAPAPDLTAATSGPFVIHRCGSLADAARWLQANRCEALVLRAATPADLEALTHWHAMAHAVADLAVLVMTPKPAAADVTRLLRLGVQEVLPTRGLDAERLGLALRQAVLRKQLETAARRAHATDLATGLPNRAQLTEHMTHLLALREREPAPMALIELRVEGLAAVEAALGAESVNVLRRKIAVRLRSLLRASDVVASLGLDRFAVLLAWIDAAADGDRVTVKLAQSLQRPLSVAGREVTVAIGAGIARYPGDARDADALLRLAASEAAQAPARGRTALPERIEHRGSAANDELPTQF